MNEFKVDEDEEYIEEVVDVEPEEVKNYKPKIHFKNQDVCPECGSELIHEGGCVICQCGWSRCG
jgi:ribonucleoside-diphosphate reductase alpha chain